MDVLRDIRCTAVVVRRDLVPDDKLNGRLIGCVLIDGTARRTPTARIYIETPFYVGEVEAMCMNKPMFSLIVGNIPGVKDIIPLFV